MVMHMCYVSIQLSCCKIFVFVGSCYVHFVGSDVLKSAMLCSFCCQYVCFEVEMLNFAFEVILAYIFIV